MCQKLIEIIKNLISQKKEGDYWDFKQEWDKNNGDLIRDILSLSNNIEQKGDRYLIFGVTDPPACKVVGCNSPRKTQADLLDLFSNLVFAGSINPDIRLETCKIGESEIDVVIIRDKSFKPYFLQKEYKDGKEHVHAGTIYSRVGDKNTAKNSTADLYHTEKMWRERLGLDKTPLKRMQQYLQDFNGWHSDGISNNYYKQFPEFTFEYIGKEKNVTGRWWKIFLGKKTTASKIVFKYHTTLLKEIIICRFSRENICIPYPDVDFIQINDSNFKDAKNTYCLFSFIKDTFDFSLLFHLYGDYKSSLDDMFERKAISSPEKPPIKHLPFIVFGSSIQKEQFISWLETNMKLFFKEKKLKPKCELGETQLKEEETFAYWAYDKYHDKIRKNNKRWS